MSDKKTVLQNFLDWLRLNHSENSVVIGKVLSIIEDERLQIEDSFHQAQLEMINIIEDQFKIKSDGVDPNDREDAQEYYRNKYMFNDNIIEKNKN
jgi:hypothetical protein